MSLVSFRTPCSWDIPTARSPRCWDEAIFQVIQYSLFVRLRELGTSRWRLALQSSQCEPLSCLAETRESGFNTKSLQIWFQKCAEHLSVASWISCYCPACFVFKETGADHPKRCYTTPKNNLLRMKSFLVNISRVLGCPVAIVLRTDIATNMKICFICHENVVKVVVIQSVQQNLTKSFSIHGVLIIYCLNHSHFVRMELSPHAIFGILYDQTVLMQWHFCLLITEDFWQKPDAFVRRCQEF